MNKPRFLMIGGFLGAGKTTAIARLARHYMAEGRRIAIVTNDQAFDLVDTHSLRGQGFDVGEVPGACFCCKFDDLVRSVEGLSRDEAPEIIIAEPVGSCTDLVATVIEPMRRLYDKQYEVGSLAVLLKPEHGRKILRGDAEAGFSPKAAYIFLKQIEEADIVVLNKIDKLSDGERAEILSLVAERYPEKEVLAVSAKTGEGFDSLVELISLPGSAHEWLMDVDYDIYAAGEAELGWLNCQVCVAARENEKFSLDGLLLDLLARLRNELIAADAEAAHLKIMGEAKGEAAVANLVGSDVEVELSLASEIDTDAADLIVNARVAVDPEGLERIVESAVAALAGERSLQFEITGMQRFRPGRPVPTHRVTSGA